jgi:MFS superfamily sulfate permease-like transporter
LPAERRAGLARWLPGLAQLLHYDPAWLAKDVAAGLSVAAIALPVGIAYADLTGVPAALGIYSAIFPLLAYALFGSSRQLIIGPDAATCIMVAASLAPLAQGDPQRYLALLPVLTLMTGALYLLAGLALMAALVVLRRFAPGVPAALVVVVAGIAAMATLDLEALGVAVTGAVPAGLPSLDLAWFDPATYRSLFGDAAGIVLISFTGGVLTAQSFARRNRYTIDADQELIAFGAGNLAAGLAQGFPVTGADSRTAVNDAMGGKSQLVGVVAAAAMLLVLFFGTGPLALVPTTALAAVILVSAAGLFDIAGLRLLVRMSWREGLMSLATTLGVLVLGVLPGVVLAAVLALFWLLVIALRPGDAVLGRVPGLKGFHSTTDYPQAETVPGLLLYRFNANLVFFNVDYFCERVRMAVRHAAPPVVWVIVDLAPVNVVDATAVQRFDELREELAAQGVTLGIARAKHQLGRAFDPRWVEQRLSAAPPAFPTLKSAVRAFLAAQAAVSAGSPGANAAGPSDRA